MSKRRSIPKSRTLKIRNQTVSRTLPKKTPAKVANKALDWEKIKIQLNYQSNHDEIMNYDSEGIYFLRLFDYFDDEQPDNILIDLKDFDWSIELLKILLEYYKIVSLPNFSEEEEAKLLNILELSNFDDDLSRWIDILDELIAHELLFNNSSNLYFIHYLDDDEIFHFRKILEHYLQDRQILVNKDINIAKSMMK
ncbi:hypothetical protein [Nostoc sp. UIC 10630]|uniref:hypothetical protein n=1 Tax=Nostoc sp. UIC 10630 TaxID=2100146 RepID=UPI0013D32269|nr:hypothetical protein [Nostoc sp. UIC 10630]NEU77642.1 hypothetical protein [Nostoc sp. UIC 10630]